MKSLLGKLENDTRSEETEREEDVFTWLNGQGGICLQISGISVGLKFGCEALRLDLGKQ